MGVFYSKPNPSGQRPHCCNHSSSNNAASRGKNRFARFGDDYHTLEQVTDAHAHAGLESSNLIVGIDFTKSNEWTATTHDQKVFSFYPDNRPCDGFEQALDRYREIVPQLRLAGPTSFAPVIETVIGIVDSSGGQYHVLLIIADGQVTCSVDTGNGQLSPQERETIDAIVKASDYPLSIVLVGVGDGPWDMRQFDDNIPSRAFDNFQFVNFTEIMSRPVPASKKEAEFALSALMEIPEQFKAAINLQLLGYHCLIKPNKRNLLAMGHQKKTSAPSQDSDIGDQQTCPICWLQAKNLAFGCGHQTCSDCGKDLKKGTKCQI
ncbi:hypothetical protein E2562_031634 [Oryza meyeriana var. granulata]|uniref:Copine C-terminal domain-containing protein n=1 Tax=Oryza meyeriana var. granulata TaxID=110450 RepID=A0A6G1D9N4_9ORYZ|nr:hypothetical protein E2562_031634 [Oryza meyeriana var. granulata]